jgi:AcrR family transcriptional regulator
MRMNDRSGRDKGVKEAGALLPPNVAADGTRRRVLEGALRLFATQGFHGSSMRELAKLVELQPSALYVHFPSKEHVLAELVRAGHEAHHNAIRAAMLEVGADPIAQLRAIVAVHVRLHATYLHLAIVINREMDALSAELAAPGRTLRAQASALLLEIIERGTAMRCFAPPHVYVAAAAIAAMGLRVPEWYTPAAGIGVDELVEHHVEMALRIVGATRAV